MNHQISPCLANTNWCSGTVVRSHSDPITEPEIPWISNNFSFKVTHGQVFADPLPGCFSTNSASCTAIHDCPTSSLRDVVDLFMLVEFPWDWRSTIWLFDHVCLIWDFFDARCWQPVSLESRTMLWGTPTRRWSCRCRCRWCGSTFGRWLPAKDKTSGSRKWLVKTLATALALALATTFAFWLSFGFSPTARVAAFPIGFTSTLAVVVVHVNGNHRVEPTGES